MTGMPLQVQSLDSTSKRRLKGTVKVESMSVGSVTSHDLKTWDT
jgi:hypothetical protein